MIRPVLGVTVAVLIFAAIDILVSTSIEDLKIAAVRFSPLDAEHKAAMYGATAGSFGAREGAAPTPVVDVPHCSRGHGLAHYTLCLLERRGL